VLDFIADEIAKHCPNPRPRSKRIIADIPLILWQVLLLAEEGAYSRSRDIKGISQLTISASSKLATGGMIVAQGDLARKVCGPLLSRYTALCVARCFSDADGQRAFIRERAERVFCAKFTSLLFNCNSRQAGEMALYLTSDRVGQALTSDEANQLLSGQITCAPIIPKVIKFGRVLFA